MRARFGTWCVLMVTGGLAGGCSDGAGGLTPIYLCDDVHAPSDAQTNGDATDGSDLASPLDASPGQDLGDLEDSTVGPGVVDTVVAPDGLDAADPPDTFIGDPDAPSPVDATPDPDVWQDTGTPSSTCPNGQQEPGEVCDGPVLCAALRGDQWIGTATCSSDCQSLDTSACRTVLGTAGWPAPSCAAIPADGVDDPSAVFWVDQGNGPHQLYCELADDGGGWALVSSRVYAPVPGAWGQFSEGALTPTPQIAGVLPFLELFPTPTAVRLAYPAGAGPAVVRTIAPGAAWETLGNGLRIAVTGGDYLIFSNQPTAQGEAVCVTTGVYDTGFKCDGNEGQLEGGQGLFSLFAEDDFCNCDSFGWKAEVGGCLADVCSPEGLVSVYLR